MQDFRGTSATAELDAGTLLCSGRYRIERRLAGGGVATVYAATLMPNEAPVALKILNESCVHKRQFASRMRNEMQLGAGLQTVPNMVRPLDYGEVPELDGRPYIAFELQEGLDLGSLPKPLDPLLACKIARSLADTLAHLHGRGVVHRDVKPTNVIVDLDDGVRVRLIDLGYASSIGCGMLPDTRGLTAEIEMTGTLEYMAPEHILGQPAAPSFDMYGLASTLWEMVLGTNPQSGRRQADISRMLCDATIPSLSASGHPLAFGIDPELVALIDRGLKKDVGERVPSAAEFRDALNGIVTRLETARAGAGGTEIAVAEAPEGRRGAAEALNAASSVLQASCDVLVGRADTRITEVAPASDAPHRTSSKAIATRRIKGGYTLTVGIIGFVGLTTAGVLSMPSPTKTDTAIRVSSVRAVPEVRASARPHVQLPSVARETFVRAHVQDLPVATSDAGARSTPKRPSSVSSTPAARGTPTPRRVKTKTPPQASTEASLPSTSQCPEASANVKRAEKSKAWKAVLRLTESAPHCWSDTSRASLRINAFINLGRLQDCEAEGARVTDPDVQRQVAVCRRRRG